MVRMPYISNYTRAELERMKAQEVKDLAANITGLRRYYEGAAIQRI